MGTLGTGQAWFITPTTPLAPRVMTTTPSSPSCWSGPEESSSVDVLRLTGQVTQEVHLMDAAVDEHPAAVQVAAAAPLAGLERASSCCCTNRRPPTMPRSIALYTAAPPP